VAQHIELTIENHTFHILTYIVKNLSSPIILRNDFLIKNNAHIDYGDKIRTLNNNIKTKLYFSSMNMNNINEIHPQNILEILEKYCLILVENAQH